MPGGDAQTSPRRVLAAVSAAVLACCALWGSACTVVVVLRPNSVVLDAALAVSVAVGFSLIGLWLCLVLRIARIGWGGDGRGGEGWDRDLPDPPVPQLPSDGLDLWPQFERDLRAYLETRERTPVAS